MTPAGPVLAGLLLSLAAIAALAALDRTISSRDRWAPLNRRFLFGIRLTMLLFAGRALVVVTGIEGFRFLILLAAALIPLAVLLLAEGLMRRHAPRAIKLWVAGGAVVFGVMAIVHPLAGQAGLWALLALQLSGLAMAGGLVLWGDREGLSPAETRAAGRLSLSLLAIIPLAALDFIVPLTGVPVQPSGLAVMFLCWLAIGLGRTDEDHWRSVLGFAAVLAAAIVLAGFLALSLGLSGPDFALVAAVVLAVMLVPAIWRDALFLGQEARDRSLLRHIAEAPDTAEAFLDTIRAHPLIDGALVLEAGDLAGLDLDRLGAVLARRPVLRRGDLSLGEEAADHAQHLFERFGASHLLCVGRAPLRLLALSLPDLSASSRAELELGAVQRMACLLAEKA